MKRLFTSSVFSLFSALISFAQFTGAQIDSQGVQYTANDDGTSCYVSGHHYIDYSPIIVIPEVYEGLTVTSIGKNAFRNCSNLTSVTIPNSVTSIGEYSFEGCNGLTSVTIPSSVTSIGSRAFEDCGGLTSITIPNSVTSMERRVFEGCNNLTSITLHCPEIGEYCFKDLASIKEVVFGKEVTSIGRSAFENCNGLTSITIPNNVTSIGSSAFRDCRSLTSVIIPNSVTTIGYGLFEGCSGLISVTIPNSVTSIGDYAFEDCNNLTSITIPNSVTSMGYRTFSGCSALKSFVIPNSVTTVGEYVFEGCSNLSELIIGKSVTSISHNSLSGCSFESVTILCPSVEFSSLFLNISSIENLIIGPDVTKIVDYGTNIHPVSIKVDPENSVYDSRNDCNAIIETSTGKLIRGCENTIIPNNVTSIGRNAFSYSIFSSIDIPNSVTSIDNYAFSRSELTSMVLPNSVTYIGEEVFGYCSNLVSVTFPNSITSIQPLTFCGCSSLTSFVIPNSVTSIGRHAFNGCQSILSITIPKSVTSIGDYVFKNCSSLSSIFVEDGNKYYDSSNNCNAIIKTSSKTLIAGCKNTIIPNYITSIEKGAFDGCSGLSQVKIPNSVESIGVYAFNGCSGMSILKIGKGVKTYGQGCFEGCVNLTDVYCYATTAPNISANTMWGPFARTPIENFILHVPAGCKESYAAIEAWNKFKEIVEMSEADTESTYDVNGDGSFGNDDVSSLVGKVLGRNDGTESAAYSFDANKDDKVDITDVVQVIGLINDIQQGNLPETDDENEGGYEEPTETEQQVMQMSSDEEGDNETVYSQADSLEYAALAQEVISRYDTDEDDDYNTSESRMLRSSMDDLAQEAIRKNGNNIFKGQLEIEQQNWDSKRWGNTRYGGFKTFYNTMEKYGRRYLLVVFYYKGGFPNRKTAYLKLGQLNSGKIICKAPIYTGQEFAALSVCIDDYLQDYGCFNVFPLLITEESKARNYLNPFLVKGKPIVNNDWRDKPYGYEFGKINGVSVYCNTSPQGKNQGGIAYKYQCVELCKRYVSELNSNIKYNELSGNANQWPSFRDEDGRFLVFSNDGREQVREGDLIVWDHGTFGHIGVVTKTQADEITVAHQNGGIGTYASPVETKMKLVERIIKDIAPGTNRSPIYKSIQTIPYFIRINSAGEKWTSYDASMTASTTNMTFAPTQVGKSVTQSIKIANTKGAGPLTVSSITLSRGKDFSVDVSNFTIEPGETQIVKVTFTPSSSGECKDRIVIRSNADDNPTWVIHLSGSGTGN